MGAIIVKVILFFAALWCLKVLISLVGWLLICAWGLFNAVKYWLKRKRPLKIEDKKNV